jgi:O-antigen ligase
MSGAVGAVARRAERARFPWIALLPLALIPFFGQTPEGLDRILLAVEGTFFVLGVRRPIWILAALLVSELTVANYIWEFGDFRISNRLVLTLAAVPVVLPHVIQRPDLGPRAKSMLLVALAFVAVTTFANAVASDGTYVLKFARFLMTGVILLALVPAVVRSSNDLRDLAMPLLVVSAVSALVAILQHYSQFGSAPLYETIPHVGAEGESFESWGGRALGLTENPIYATNALLLSFTLTLGVVLLAKIDPRVRSFLVVILLMTAAGLFFTYTRSWAYSAGAALLAMGLLYKGRYGREFWLLVILGAGLFLYWSDMQGNRYTLTSSNDSSAAARSVLWDVGLQMALDHPFLGVGHDKFLELSPEYAPRVNKETLERQGAGSALGKYTPHNDYLNVWLSFGTGALIVYLALFILACQNYIDAYFASQDDLVKGLSLGGLGALLAFGVNAFFHNLFDSTLTIWLLAGLSLAIAKVVSAEASRRGRAWPRVA